MDKAKKVKPQAEKKEKKAPKPKPKSLKDGVTKFAKKKTTFKVAGKKGVQKVKKPMYVEKPIGGDKNGKTRMVRTEKRTCYYPTQDKLRKHRSISLPVTTLKTTRMTHRKREPLRKTLTPGTVCILVASQHKGKRVVFLKQLNSGLILVTGPFCLNACPMRRISQNYVIATSTKLDISGVKIPDNINDGYFKRAKKTRRKAKGDGDIFTVKKEQYQVNDQRKSDQKTMDKAIVGVIKKHPEHKMLFKYLVTMFGLRSSQFPHRMKF